MTEEAPLHKIPIVIDTGRTNYRIGYGGDEKPRSTNTTVYWVDPTTGEANFSPVPNDRSVPVYSIYSGAEAKPVTVENFSSTRVPDSDKLIEFLEYHTLEKLNLRNDLSRYPFHFSREDRSDKISYPEPKKEKGAVKKDFMEIAKQREQLK